MDRAADADVAWFRVPAYFLPTGKFEMQVMSGCGHSVHEDAPDKVIRNR